MFATTHRLRKVPDSSLKEEQSFPLPPPVQWAVTMTTFTVFSLLTMFTYNIFKTNTMRKVEARIMIILWVEELQARQIVTWPD